MADIGDRVKWSNLQRVELDDMDAVSTVQQGNLARVAGILLDNFNSGSGNVVRGGLLSRLRYDGTNPAAVTFGPMAIVYAPVGSEDTDPGPAQVFRYDRTKAWQATYSTASLNFGGLGSNKPFVWARRIEVDADLASRRFWDELTELEYTTSVHTRVREAVELALSPLGLDNNPPSAGAWVRIARVVSVTSEVILAPRHDFDGYDPVYEASATSRENGQSARFYADPADATRLPTLPEFARFVLAALCKLHDGRRVFNERGFLANASVANLRSWRHGLTDDTFRGLKQVQDEIDALDTTVDTLNGLALTVYSAYLTWGGSNWVIEDEVGIPGLTATIAAESWGTGHRALLTLVNVPTGWTITRFDVDAYQDSGFNPPPPAASAVIPTVVMKASIEPLPFASDGATDFNIQAGFAGLDTGDPNEWLYFHAKFSVTVHARRT